MIVNLYQVSMYEKATNNTLIIFEGRLPYNLWRKSRETHKYCIMDNSTKTEGKRMCAGCVFIMQNESRTFILILTWKSFFFLSVEEGHLEYCSLYESFRATEMYLIQKCIYSQFWRPHLWESFVDKGWFLLSISLGCRQLSSPSVFTSSSLFRCLCPSFLFSKGK